MSAVDKEKRPNHKEEDLMSSVQKRGNPKRFFVTAAMIVAVFSIFFAGCATQSASLDGNLEADKGNAGSYSFPLPPEFFAGGDGIGDL